MGRMAHSVANRVQVAHRLSRQPYKGRGRNKGMQQRARTKASRPRGLASAPVAGAQLGLPKLLAPAVQPAQRLPAASALPNSFCRMAGTGGRSLPT